MRQSIQNPPPESPASIYTSLLVSRYVSPYSHSVLLKQYSLYRSYYSSIHLLIHRSLGAELHTLLTCTLLLVAGEEGKERSFILPILLMLPKCHRRAQCSADLSGTGLSCFFFFWPTQPTNNPANDVHRVSIVQG